MFNWSSDLIKADKKSKDYKIWKLEQLINYGLNGEKISEKEVKKYWSFLNLDPDKQRALKYLIWGKLYSLPNNLTFWNLHKHKLP